MTLTNSNRPFKDKKLRLLQWNAGGLSQHKKTELQRILIKHNVEIFAIMEANKTLNDLSRYQFSGYTIYVLEKNRQVASGILIGVKNTLTSTFNVIKEMGDTSDKLELIYLNVWKAGVHFKIYAAYNPPNNKPNLDAITTGNKTIFLGDFNAPSKTWGYISTTTIGQIFEDFLDTSNMELVYNNTDPPTYIHYSGTGTNPDLLFVSSDISSATSRKVIEDPGSGHRIVLANIQLPTPNNNCFRSKPSWNFKKANWTSYEVALESELDINNINFEQHPDKILKQINCVILQNAKKYIPLGRQKRYKCFWNSQLDTLKQQRDTLRKKAEETNDPADVQNWRRSAALTKRTIMEAKRSCFNNFITKLDYKKDGHKTYNFLSKLQNKRMIPRKQPIQYENTNLVSDDDIANAFASYYSKSQKKTPVMKKCNRHIKKQIKSNQNHTLQNDIFNANFSIYELNIAISQLRSKKSPGPDLIFSEFIQHMGNNAKQTLLHLFNTIWALTVPSQWKKAIVVPILKRDKSPSDVSSYRPISLTCITAKIMERMISNRLTWYFESNGIIHPNQAGFRKHRSTEQQVAILSQNIKDNIDKNQVTTAVYIDFKSAYDSVWKENLLLKLSHYGVGGKMLHWLTSFISQRYCQVRYGDAVSKFKQLQTGLPQGTITSCLLFNIYVNDLIPAITKQPNVLALMYADDLVLWTSAKKQAIQQVEHTLNVALEDLHNWCTENSMTVNTSKSACQSFSLCHRPLQPSIIYNNNQLENVNKFQYLGVLLDCRMSWKEHIDTVVEKTQKRLSVLKRLAGCKWGCATSTLNTTYKMYIKPVMTYCCGLLITASHQNTNKLERVQNHALRLITGAVKSTPINAMLLFTNNLEVKAKITENALKVHEKLIRLPDVLYHVEEQNTCRRLKTQEGIMQHAIKKKDLLGLSTKPGQLPPIENPLEIFKMEYALDLNHVINKSDVSPEILRYIALETISTRYPADSWLYVYTDGSKISTTGNTGSGIYSDLFATYISLGKDYVAFDGEIEAIRTALFHLICRSESFLNVAILSDSQAAIGAIGNYLIPAASKEIVDCRRFISSLTRLQKRVILQWIPSHCGIPGNEAADQLAKRGTQILQSPMKEIPFHRVATIIHSKIKSEHDLILQEKIKDSIWKDKINSEIPDWPRKEAVAKFRIATGHDCLATHLHRLGILNSPLCLLCRTNINMDASHLQHCPALTSTTLHQRYWEAREKMMISLPPAS